MSILLYLGLLAAALYWVSKMLLPEMAKPPLPKEGPGTNNFEAPQIKEIDNNRIQKLEVLLAEKNKNIKILQSELTVFLVQVREFDKVKSLLEEEIHRLREQNRMFRSELGLPAVQPKEASLT